MVFLMMLISQYLACAMVFSKEWQTQDPTVVFTAWHIPYRIRGFAWHTRLTLRSEDVKSKVALLSQGYTQSQRHSTVL